MMFEKLWEHKLLKFVDTETKRQAFLFLFVGGINTLFSYSCFALFIYVGFHYTVAALASTSLGVLFNFNTTGKLVFNSLHYRLIFKFIGVYVFLYVMDVIFLKGLQVFSTNYYLTQFMTVFPLAIMSFILNKYLVFNKRAKKIAA